MWRNWEVLVLTLVSVLDRADVMESQQTWLKAKGPTHVSAYGSPFTGEIFICDGSNKPDISNERGSVFNFQRLNLKLWWKKLVVVSSKSCSGTFSSDSAASLSSLKSGFIMCQALPPLPSPPSLQSTSTSSTTSNTFNLLVLTQAVTVYYTPCISMATQILPVTISRLCR